MYKEVILNNLIPYVKKMDIPHRKAGKITMIQCPFCKNEQLSATLIPNSNLLNCCPCGKKFTVIDLVRGFESDKSDWDDEKVMHYLKELLNLNVKTKMDEKVEDDLLSRYESFHWACLPVISGDKRPAESEWTSREHKSKDEWREWLENGLNLGARTGAVSNLTVIDIDAMPGDLKKKLYDKKLSPTEEKEAYAIKETNLKLVLEELGHPEKNTLTMYNTGGVQLFYHHTEELPKTQIEVAGVKIDIENDGGQVVVPPSKVSGHERNFVNDSIIDIPEKVLKKLKENVTVPRKTESESIFNDIVTEDFKIKMFDDGNRNASLIRLGGVFRKELNPKQTEFVLHVLNNHNTSSLPYREIIAMSRKLEQYASHDEHELAHKILKYLELAEMASKAEIEIAVLGKRATGEDKQRIDKILVNLIQDEKIIKKGERQYKLVTSMEWSDSLINMSKPVPFEVPYVGTHAYFNWGDFIILGSQNKFGKCHSKGTEILMADGTLKKVEDIKSGDKLQGYHNQIRTVQDTCTGYGQMYEIKPVASESFVVNDEHILCLYNLANYEYQEISVKNYLATSDYYKNMTVLYSDPIEWEEQDIDINPYFLGIWLGDGHSADGRITTKDEEIVQFLHKYADKLNYTVSEYHPKNRCPMYAVVNKNHSWQNKYDLQQRLRKYNLLNNKHIPNEFKINSRANRLNLLAGLIDSDGYLTKKNNFELSFKNKRLAKDVVFLARSLGFQASFKKYKASFNSVRYRIFISGQTALIPTKIKRKQSTKMVCAKDALHFGFKIKKLNKQHYYGFTLDGDKKYLLSNFIVNHNTTLAMNVVKQFVDQGIKPYYIYSESGGRFKKTALRLGMKDGDFNHIFCGNPYEIHLEPNAVTIYDWVRPVEGFNKTDDLYDGIVQKLHKTQGFMICFAQLKKDNSWFSPNMITQFPALACKYLYEEGSDGTDTYFEITEVRDAKTKGKQFKIPCKYNWETKEVNKIEETISGE